jgi:hypothetical protein
MLTFAAGGVWSGGCEVIGDAGSGGEFAAREFNGGPVVDEVGSVRRLDQANSEYLCESRGGTPSRPSRGKSRLALPPISLKPTPQIPPALISPIRYVPPSPSITNYEDIICD